MKNLFVMLAILTLVACQDQELQPTDSNHQMALRKSNVKLLGLDQVPIIPFEEDINDLIKNPDDPSDESMSYLLYDLSIAVQPLIADQGFNDAIMTLANVNGENTVSFETLRAHYPNYYSEIDNNLTGSSISDITSRMVYENPAGGNPEYYLPGIHIPNLKIANAERQPLLSAQIVNSGKDERLEDFILCTYHTGEGVFESTWLGAHTADVSSNPIMVIDNLEKNKKGKKGISDSQEINQADVNDKKSFAEDMTEKQLEKQTSFQYFIKQYKIAHRYDNSRRSEYSYRLDRRNTGSITHGGVRTGIKNIHKNDINHLFYDNFCVFELNYSNTNLEGVFFVTFEYDWFASNKTTWISGHWISFRSKFSSHWYQKFFFDYDGSGVSNSSKGYIKLESDLPCTTCPPGYAYDGANCYSGVQAPLGYNIFIWGTAFYVQQNCSISTSNACCPSDFGYDGANCHSFVEIPSGYTPFVWNRGFYVQPSCE